MFMTPVVHWSHGRALNGFRAIGGVVGSVAFGALSGEVFSETMSVNYQEQDAVISVFAVAGYVAWAAVDVMNFSKVPKRYGSLAIHPYVHTSDGNTTAGLVGGF